MVKKVGLKMARGGEPAHATPVMSPFGNCPTRWHEVGDWYLAFCLPAAGAEGEGGGQAALGLVSVPSTAEETLILSERTDFSSISCFQSVHHASQGGLSRQRFKSMANLTYRRQVGRMQTTRSSWFVAFDTWTPLHHD